MQFHSYFQLITFRTFRADMASHGIAALDLVNNSMWWTLWTGSEFLSTAKDNWPVQPVKTAMPISPERQEVNRIRNEAATTTMLTRNYTFIKPCHRLDPVRYSDLRRPGRAQAWVLRFINNSQSLKQNKIQGKLRREEIQESEISRQHVSACLL